MVKRRTLTFLALLLSGSCAQDPKPLTQLVLVADTDVSGLDAVLFQVRSDDGSRVEMSTVARTGANPSYVSVVRDEGPIGPLTVSAMGLVNGESTGIVRTHRVSFVLDQTRVVKLHLAASCAGKVCAASDTCTEEGCTPSELLEEQLPFWTGQAPRITDLPDLDAAVPAPPDASAAQDGGDARVPQDGGDAATPPDAGDAGDAGVDAGSDAGTDAAVDSGAPDSGLTQCLTGMYDLQNDYAHCGSCFKSCGSPGLGINSHYMCVQGQCTTAVACMPLYGDCSLFDLGVSCETKTSNPTFCPCEGAPCPANERCDVTGNCVAK